MIIYVVKRTSILFHNVCRVGIDIFSWVWVWSQCNCVCTVLHFNIHYALKKDETKHKIVQYLPLTYTHFYHKRFNLYDVSAVGKYALFVGCKQQWFNKAGRRWITHSNWCSWPTPNVIHRSNEMGNLKLWNKSMCYAKTHSVQNMEIQPWESTSVRMNTFVNSNNEQKYVLCYSVIYVFW